jgi:hypothetical protein
MMAGASAEFRDSACVCVRAGLKAVFKLYSRQHQEALGGAVPQQFRAVICVQTQNFPGCCVLELFTVMMCIHESTIYKGSSGCVWLCTFCVRLRQSVQLFVCRCGSNRRIGWSLC